ncbi:hypothetical protein CQW23_08592 [Capsicum baccatum]|uniref:Retrovirus-related Pol polyprotein from transposon TNT 1-94-like beta-barrel domain-containing protein n=1 Tax=Capsicum baccatum TaxID=33114 RepID=A0A2G2X9I0_CAPBA|nr:hypothetical protein CQW23_08592 [Capsicum baccatum]
MDSGTRHLVTPDLDNLGIHSEYQGPKEVTIGNGSKLRISHVGKSLVILSNKKFHLDDILHVLTATQNLLSISSFAKSNQVSIEFFPNHFLIKDLVTRDIVNIGPINDGLYSLAALKSSTPASYAAFLWVWHAPLAHTSFPTVHQALSSSVIVPSFKSSSLCSTCVVTKSHKDIVAPPSITNAENEPLNVIVPFHPSISPTSIQPMMPQPSIPVQTSKFLSPSPPLEPLTNHRSSSTVDPFPGDTSCNDPPSQHRVYHGPNLISANVVKENTISSNTSITPQNRVSRRHTVLRITSGPKLTLLLA